MVLNLKAAFDRENVDSPGEEVQVNTVREPPPEYASPAPTRSAAPAPTHALNSAVVVGAMRSVTGAVGVTGSGSGPPRHAGPIGSGSGGKPLKLTTSARGDGNPSKRVALQTGAGTTCTTGAIGGGSGGGTVLRPICEE